MELACQVVCNNSLELIWILVVITSFKLEWMAWMEWECSNLWVKWDSKMQTNIILPWEDLMEWIWVWVWEQTCKEVKVRIVLTVFLELAFLKPPIKTCSIHSREMVLILQVISQQAKKKSLNNVKNLQIFSV